MKSPKALWAGTVITAVLVCGGGYLAFGGSDEGAYTIQPAEGGEWDYGSSGGRTWSNFRHEAPHSTSVQGHEFVDSGCVAGNSWARVQAPSRWLAALGDQQDKSLCQP